MTTPPRDLEFEGGYKPKGKVVAFPKGPVVLRFPPSAYRVVQADELKQWQQEIKDQLGLVFDVDGASAGTVTYYARGGSGTAYRHDSDIESGSDVTVENERPGRLRRWDAKPVVLHLPPVAYELVEPDQLREWTDEVSRHLGIYVGGVADVGVPTWSYCVGPQGEAYPCDSDWE